MYPIFVRDNWWFVLLTLFVGLVLPVLVSTGRSSRERKE